MMNIFLGDQKSLTERHVRTFVFRTHKNYVKNSKLPPIVVLNSTLIIIAHNLMENS